ncbi:allophanate hydrolase [Xylanibacillus composti]|uniref:Allophanate hydrolase n=1 Tax=Xylanibacillus composti TaxID=1572762 RepID=A0A8J4H6M7_9BACL|nr:allophanate hydrolase [Xylanibacillus composti]MDT9726144.1 allophanate hydrolase [Xylanibacillus composti]GIQ70621.1 allophanate hydrolase [Xylanibacillus composti]
MIATELPRQWTVDELRDMYARKDITPAEVVQEIIRRVHEDKEMHIWITPPTMDRLRPYLDRLDRMDPARHPLWGIPFAIKDNIDLAGVPTTAACPDYAYTPGEHATVVQRLIDAGALPLGKTNLDQFATGLVGTRSPFGETHNALRSELISGGSSSGSAVAVARGHAVFALGTDTAGSGRVPAALNGLVGYKPSLGAWPTRGVVPACASLDCVTVFTHTLEEALTVDACVRGVDALDPWSRPVVRTPAAQPAKWLVPDEPLEFYGPFADAYRQAWEAALAKLEAMQAPVERVNLALFAEAAAILYEGPWVAERWSDLGEFVMNHPGKTFPVTERILRSGGGDQWDAASVFQAMHKLQELKRQARELLRGGVLMLPTCGGTWSREEVRQDPIAANNAMGRYTNHCNLLDLSAVAVPGDEAAPDLPFGVTFFALAEQEGLAAEAARHFLKKQPTTLVAVCGLHMRGFPLEKQMREHGARFVREDRTAAKYRMLKLPTTPAKPGLIKSAAGGGSLRLEVWEMPLATFGAFAALIPAPLGIGKVELEDGTEVPGFICEGYAIEGAEDITARGGWR